MSKSEKKPIKNAAQVIEKFGGIRPMSSKINVAVTTIQGWKKRDVIPANRRETIIKFAEEYKIDIEGLLAGKIEVVNKAEPSSEKAPAENTSSKTSAKDGTAEAGSDKVDVGADQADDTSEPSVAEVLEKDLANKVANTQDYTEVAVAKVKNGAVMRSGLIAAALVLIVLAALAGFMWPKYQKFEERETRLEELEGRLGELKTEQTSFKGLVPDNWKEEIAELKVQAKELKQQASQKTSQVSAAVGSTYNAVKSASKNLASSTGVTERATQLQTYVSEVVSDDSLFALKTRFDDMRADFMGEKILENSVSALLPIMSSSDQQDESHLNAMIASARESNQSLQQSLGSVPQQELKAAAMLLAMTQVRSALNRKDEDFEGDLQLLKTMIGEDNTPLWNSIQKLTPHAKNGILTPGGLRSEFQTVAGDAVAASLSGQDVSVSEKFSAKFNEILKVEKDGELLTGTETQSALNEAENLIEQDQWEDAVSLLQRELKAKELAPILPWITEVEKFVTSQRLDKLIEQAMKDNFGSSFLGGSKTLP